MGEQQEPTMNEPYEISVGFPPPDFLAQTLSFE